MTSTVHQFPVISGYTITEQIYWGSRTTVYRATQYIQKLPVVIKVLQREYPTFGELVQFRNQYAISKNLPIVGIIQPLSLEKFGNSYALIMEDWGGISLETYIQQQSLDIADILGIAIQLANILHELQQHRVIHKDIKPANILIHPESKQVKVIDFSIASLLPKETQEIQNPNTLEGTLAYLAPEQTGRMNRGIDYRSDFYALGVTLYQMLTGRLPFIADDPLELVHCHIAKIATPAHEVSIDVPPILGAIVAKLMAKNAEDRYQNALGLKHDLGECCNQWKQTGSIAEFELGQRDLCDRFIIPEKLYGRETEVQTLLDAFERVAVGTTELMLVAGFSGIGKTAVVNEVHKPIIKQRGYFIKGKFDQFNRNVPFSAFVQAFRDLMGQLLSESDAQLQHWKTQILAALGENAQVVVELIPELERIIGTQPPVPELSGTAAQNRFNLLFQKFIQVFTQPKHPLVMFVDDLQWADSASLNLIQVLMSESQTGCLLLLGAYRDNEVFAAHPLTLTLEGMEKAGATINTITLQPLSFTSLNHLIADTLHAQETVVKPLTELVMQKTHGNPFFATQFLKALHQDQLITFNSNAGYWQCDIVQVRDAALTDDVVELMAQQLQKLPQATQEILKLAACIGAQFDLNTLAIVSQQSPTDVATTLWKALQEGLILPQSDLYKFYLEEIQTTQHSPQETLNYRFLHDRVQQAAYSLIPEVQKQVTHLQIGQLLLQGLSPLERIEQIFEIVNQLNLGRGKISDAVQKQQLAQLNLQAGQKAKLSAAYQAAQNYYDSGIDLLTTEAWQTDYALIYTLHREGAEAAYLCSNFDRAEALYVVTLDHAQTPLDKAVVYRIQMTQYQLQGRNAEAIAIQRQSLQLLGWMMPKTPESIQATLEEEIATVNRFLEQQTIESILSFPKMENENIAELLRILQILFYAAWLDGQPTLALLALAKMTTLSLQYGNSDMSPFGYVGYGLIANTLLKEFAIAYQFGNMAVHLCEQFDNADVRGMTNFLFAADVHSWSRPIREADIYYDNAYKYGMDGGNWLTVGFMMMQSGSDRLTYGKNLDELYAIATTHADFLRHIKSFENLDALIAGVIQPIRNLLGLTHTHLIFDDDYFSESKYLEKYSDTPYHLAWLYSVKIRNSYLFGNQAAYPDLIPQLSIIENTVSSHTKVPSSVFYVALMHISLAESAQDEQERQLHWQALIPLEEKLNQWQAACPANIVHKCLLIQAEKARLKGQKLEAINLYEEAITTAKAHEYSYEEALANELAAQFYLNWGKEKVAAGYMQEAYYCYARWGAKAKVVDLETRYPDLLRPILQQTQASTSILSTLATISPLTVSGHNSDRHSSSSISINQALDFAAILKASQALSSNIQLDELLHQLTQIILQNSGSDRCVLILPSETGEWQVRAIATPNETQLYTEPLINHPHIPVKLIQYVKNTQEMVVIDNMETTLPVIGDYLRQHQPRSVLCMPLLHQGHLIGILYLNNQLICGVFTEERILILNFLCTQAAISLENARLYQQLEHSLQDAQQKSQDLAEVLALSNGQQQILALIAQRVSLNTILAATARSIESHAHHPAYCSFLLIDAEGRLCYAAAPSLPAAYNALIDGVKIGPEVGSCGTAAYCKASVTVTDIATDPLWANYQVAVDFGLRACTSTPILGADGQVLATLAMYLPVAGEFTLHDRKLMEVATYLARIAIERHQADIELQNTQLQIVQSEKMASLGNLVAGVAHEINNPIGFLNGSITNGQDYVQDLLGHLALYQQHYPNPVEAIQDHAEDIDLEFLLEDLPKLLDSMKGATDRITNISNSLRTFSRADTEYKISANLHEGLDSTLLILKYRLKANEYRPAIQIIQEFGDLPTIECFPGQLNQVFMNILANAIDMFDEMAQTQSFQALEANPQQITIRTEVISNQVYIRMRDNGKGMTQEVQEKIFEHLFTTKAVGKGTGLGLAIARQIVVEKHGGNLSVWSELGQGTEFTIQIPVEQATTWF
ncbi:AAA family ATPase [Nostoc parmelioides]|uniref:histidine kinase n=1 Tax=Nostoc parmelioides FACHB-3921 TaxID=2692909 RepID=A0ABR8BGP9_9NOSO|nr:AAA family ATPase [Nostoc parmelioides]MBD2253056.1 AAA family ATPase [Nostoc parmelioides FACHB-3921]